MDPHCAGTYLGAVLSRVCPDSSSVPKKGRPGWDRENGPQFRAEYRSGPPAGPGPQLHTMGNKVDTHTCHTGNLYTDHVCDNNIQAVRTA